MEEKAQMRIYGYCRVSTKEQNLDRQLIELEKYVDNRFIFADLSTNYLEKLHKWEILYILNH